MLGASLGLLLVGCRLTGEELRERIDAEDACTERPAEGGALVLEDAPRFPTSGSDPTATGWTAGYAGGVWSFYELDLTPVGSVESPATGDGWNQGGPRDGWLLHQGPDFVAGGIDAIVASTDGGTVGVALSDGTETTWLLLACGGEPATGTVCPDAGATEGYTALLEVRGGFALELARGPAPSAPRNTATTLRLWTDGENLFGYAQNGDIALEVPLDGEARPSSRAGVYAYGTRAMFLSPTWFLLDDDADGVPDDEDGCPRDPSRS
jgi:hypothetical protein